MQSKVTEISRDGNKTFSQAQDNEKFGGEGSSAVLCGNTYHLFLLVFNSHQAYYTLTMLLTLQ